MAYISVDKWRTDQVIDWLKGLDVSMYGYINSFTKKGVIGSELLNIRAYELENLGMHLIGHQEIVLDAVENLRNIHYNLDTENLQFLAMHVASAASSLHRSLHCYNGSQSIETQILNDITHTIATIKPLIGWLNRSPFQGQGQFTEVCMKMLRLGLEMATIAQRDRFVEQPVDQIKKTAEVLEKLANYIIQDITDPLILQPASLSLVTLKKRESDLGFNIESSFHGVHRVTDIKHNSPAHTSGKIEDGDEIVQINYQTVVGWQNESVWKNLNESPPDVLLTLKKRPKHTKIYGQIYMQPYRLPSKKRAVNTRWGDSVPSPRPDLLTVPDEKRTFNMPSVEKKNSDNVALDSDSSCSSSDIMTPTDVKETEKEKRLFYRKPRTMLQRRNTICGDELFGRMTHVTDLPLEWLEREKAGGAACDPASPSLRDKSKSFGFGLELSPRPTTCIGIGGGSGDGGGTATNTSSVTNIQSDSCNSTKVGIVKRSGDAAKDAEKFKPGVSKVVRFDAKMKYEDHPVDEKYTCNVENTILQTFAPIPYADDDEDDDDIENSDLKTFSSNQEETKSLELPENSNNCTELLLLVDEEDSNHDKRSSVPLAEAVNIPLLVNLRRGRLDKSHSTPAYDNTGEEESDTPPAIEPRKLVLTPPVPPPRPRKQKDLLTPPAVPPPPPKPTSMLKNTTTTTPTTLILPATSTPINLNTTPTTTTNAPATSTTTTIPTTPIEVGELNTPTRTRTLTLRKKHNLIKKRRNVNLKFLSSSGDISISSHLYRRTKDHRGVTYWARLYFVMLDTILYGFRSKDAAKASSLIFLPGFTVSPAKEVHSKPHAFKVYNAANFTFYFAAESQDALNQWIEFIRIATLTTGTTTNSNTNNSQQQLNNESSMNPKELFSETDSSGEENESQIAKNLSTPSPQTSKDTTLGMMMMTTSTGSTSTTTTPTTSGKSDRRYLGSLRKLTKGTLPFKSSNSEKKASSDIPVPTEQYRCYRKVPGGSVGIQIGTNTPGYTDGVMQVLLGQNNVNKTPIMQQTAVTPTATTTPIYIKSNDKSNNDKHTDNHSLGGGGGGGDNDDAEIPQSPQLLPTTPGENQIKFQNMTTTPSPSCNSLLNSSTDSATTNLGPPSSPAPTPSMAMRRQNEAAAAQNISNNNNNNDSFDSPSKNSKKMPYNFIHASNPNLLEIDFQTSKALDYSLPKINAADSWDAHKTTHGLTLKELMLRKQKEEAQEMYNNRVCLGVEKKSKDERRRAGANTSTDSTSSTTGGGGGGAGVGTPSNVSKVPNQNKLTLRSLPKTPDYEISFKPDDESIKRTRTKEGLKLRDFGYELISGDDPIGGGSGSGGGGGENKITTSRQNSNNSTSSTMTNDSYYQQQHQQHQHYQLHQQEHGWKSAAMRKHLLKSQNFLGQKSKKHSSNSCSSSTSSNDFVNISGGIGNLGDKRAGSIKKKGKLESIKFSSERLFQFNKHSTSTSSPNSNIMTMTLPLNKKSSHHALDSEHEREHLAYIAGRSGSGIKKSYTYNNDLKDKALVSVGKYDAQRKNSAPMPLFSKLTTSNSSNKIAKEKRLLGSPLLHRTLFGSNSQQQQQQHQQLQQHHQLSHQSNIYAGREYDQEIFSQITFSKVPSNYAGENGRRLSSTSSQHTNNPNDGDVIAAAATAATTTTATATPGGAAGTALTPLKTPATTPEYPHMECPPVFEPEIYSLSEPNASLSLLLRRNNSNNSGSGSGTAPLPANEDAKQ